MIKASAALLALGALVLGAAAGAIAARALEPVRRVGSERLVTGIGGVFFKSADPAATLEWRRRHLGFEGAGPGINFFWRERDDPDSFGFTVWSAFPMDTDYFGPGEQDFMINYRVRDLDALLAQLRADGVEQVGGIDSTWYGRFAWIVDGDGNRVELWEPVSVSPEELARRTQADVEQRRE